ncbi:MAG: protoporphyrinogen/coproporphyrinogen oxidase [Nocardioides sp.]
MSGTDHDVVVVGAGLAGLACAHRLRGHGLDVVVLEAGDAVGGRVRTDVVDGYRLDHGFQLLNTAYPEVGRVLDLPALDLRTLDSAASVYVDGVHARLPNPLHEPTGVGDLVRAPLGQGRGKVALGRYAATVATLPPRMLKRREDVPATRAWREAGIPAEVVDSVLVPFLAGVVLDPEVDTSRRYTDLMMRMFARGRSVVPSLGMQRIPEQLAAGLPAGSVRLGVRVDGVEEGCVRTAGGPLTARAVVVATDGWSAAALLPGRVAAPTPRGVVTVYHAATPWEGARSTLVVDADRSPVTNTVVMTPAAPTYAPAGRALVATSLLGDEPPEAELLARLADLHATDTSGWERVGRYHVPHALPAMPAPHPLRSPVRRGAATYVCGDHVDTSSIQGALVSGRRAAEALLADLGVAP